MTILVTGSTGTIGSQVVQRLAGQGARIRALVRGDASKVKSPQGLSPSRETSRTSPRCAGAAGSNPSRALATFRSQMAENGHYHRNRNKRGVSSAHRSAGFDAWLEQA
jgi:uncharacterized protein YbjT (DUF2867 family)